MARVQRICLSGVVLGSVLLLMGTGLAQDGMKRLSRGDLATLRGGGYTYEKGWCTAGTACDTNTMCTRRTAAECTASPRNTVINHEMHCDTAGHENDDCRLSDEEKVCTESHNCWLDNDQRCHEETGTVDPVKAITVCASAPCIPH
jgi:hypothetical protein